VKEQLGEESKHCRHNRGLPAHPFSSLRIHAIGTLRTFQTPSEDRYVSFRREGAGNPMTDVEPLTQDEYRRLMTRLKFGRANGVDDTWIEALWNRHQAATAADYMERTAIHEAGHAVASHACGFEVPYVAIREDGSGETPFSDSISVSGQTATDARAQVASMLRFAIVATAGHVAEEICWGVCRYPDREIAQQLARRWFEIRSSLSKLDDRDAAALIPKPEAPNLESQLIAIVEHGERKARWVLQRNWEVTCNMAIALKHTMRLEVETLFPLFADVRIGDGLEHES